MYTIDNISYIFEIIGGVGETMGGGGWRNNGWGGGVGETMSGGVDETMKGQIVIYILLKCYLK